MATASGAGAVHVDTDSDGEDVAQAPRRRGGRAKPMKTSNPKILLVAHFLRVFLSHATNTSKGAPATC